MEKQPIRIGELFLRASVVTEEQLAEKLALSQKTGVPLGQILMQAGLVSKDQLHGAIEIQSLVLSEVLAEEHGVAALKLLVEQKMSLAESLLLVGFNGCDDDRVFRLGKLLLAAEALTPTELAEALLTSREISSPLGQVLIQTGTLSQAVVEASLAVQFQLRRKYVSWNEAIERIKAVIKFEHTTRTK